MMWVCRSCTTRYAADLERCPNDGGTERLPDHEVEQALVENDMTWDELRARVRDGQGVSEAMGPKITAVGGASFPLNRPGEGAPRFGDDEGNEVESVGREPVAAEDLEGAGGDGEQTGEQAEEQVGERLERPARNASREKWQAYADQEAPETDHSDLTRDELVELYGGE